MKQGSMWIVTDYGLTLMKDRGDTHYHLCYLKGGNSILVLHVPRESEERVQVLTDTGTVGYVAKSWFNCTIPGIEYLKEV